MVNTVDNYLGMIDYMEIDCCLMMRGQILLVVNALLCPGDRKPMDIGHAASFFWFEGAGITRGRLVPTQ